METHGAVFEELQTLAGKLSELETSNSVILKTLDERDTCRTNEQMIKPSKDLNGTLDFLTKQFRQSNKEWQTLKACISRLEGRVDDLSRTILELTQVNRLPLQRRPSKTRTGEVSATPNGQCTRENETQQTGSKKHALTRSGSVFYTTSNANTSLKSQTRTGKERNVSMVETQFRTKTKSASWQHRKEGKQPLKSNNYGLRGRRVCTEVDNRVRLIKGETSEKGQQLFKPGANDSLPAERTVKQNLPTKEEINFKSKEETSESRRTTHPVAATYEYKDLAGFSKNPETVPSRTELNTWKALAEMERKRGLVVHHSVKTGKGPNTCLLLDITGGMEGEAFNEMMAAVRTFIDGIAGVAAALDIEENIGIAIFGDQTRVVHHMTNEYDKLLNAIDLLVPSGSSPVAAGLYMALACCLGYEGNTSIKDIRIRPRVIVFSDGKGTSNMATSEHDLAGSSESDRLSRMWLTEAAEDFKIRNLRVYQVSLSNTKPKFLEDVCKKTHGKTYTSFEIHKLIRMTQNIVQAIQMIENGIDFEVMDNPLLKGFDLTDDWGEVVHLGKFLSKSEPALNIHMEQKESKLPPLGTRVRRGPDWIWGDQDEEGPGTVVGHDGNTSVWVTWDCGHRNTYRCNRLIGYDVLVVDEPRILKGEMIGVGCVVERGEHWKHENQDGGLGNVGVVINVDANGLVLVRWPNMRKCRYKFGCDGLFEVKICDSPQTHGSIGYHNTHVRGSRGSIGGADSSMFEDVTSDRLPNPINQDKGPNSEKSKNRIHADKSVEELNKRNNPMQTPGAAQNILWQYKKDEIWYDLPRDINLKTEKAYGRNKLGSTILELDGHIWRASFSEMKMKCQKTHTVTAIVRRDIST